MNDAANAHARRRLGGLPWIVAAGLVLVLAATQLPGWAQSATDESLPTVVFVARADNPVDALAASSVAGTLGGTVLLTPRDSLSPVTREALVGLDPDLVVLAGGPVALSTAVEEAIQAIPLDTRRVAGPTRVGTAAELGALADELGFGRPIVTDGTVAGDAGLAGALSVEAIDDADGIAAASAAPHDDSSTLSASQIHVLTHTVPIEVPGPGLLTASGSVGVENTANQDVEFILRLMGVRHVETVREGERAALPITASLELTEEILEGRPDPDGPVRVGLNLSVRPSVVTASESVQATDANLNVQFIPPSRGSFVAG